MLLVRSAKDDIPTRDSLFAGLSGNNMLDSINYERYSIVAQKMFKINANNVVSNAGLVSSLGVEYGMYGIDDTQTVYSPPTKIVRLYIPDVKISKDGVIKYEDLSTSQVKFYDYTLLLFVYANLSTSQDLVDLVLINDYVKTMYYTDT